MTGAISLALIALVKCLIHFISILILMVIILPLHPTNFKINFGKVKIEASFNTRAGE